MCCHVKSHLFCWANHLVDHSRLRLQHYLLLTFAQLFYVHHLFRIPYRPALPGWLGFRSY